MCVCLSKGSPKASLSQDAKQKTTRKNQKKKERGRKMNQKKLDHSIPTKNQKTHKIGTIPILRPNLIITRITKLSGHLVVRKSGSDGGIFFLTKGLQ